jgi:hypothetical protein
MAVFSPKTKMNAKADNSMTVDAKAPGDDVDSTFLPPEKNKEEKPQLDLNFDIDEVSSESAQTDSEWIELDEAAAFCIHLNNSLEDVPELGHILPLNPDSDDIITKTKDGLIFISYINFIKPRTIRSGQFFYSRYLSDKEKRTNLQVAVESAEKIGCNISEINLTNLYFGRCDCICCYCLFQSYIIVI